MDSDKRIVFVSTLRICSSTSTRHLVTCVPSLCQWAVVFTVWFEDRHVNVYYGRLSDVLVSSSNSRRHIASEKNKKNPSLRFVRYRFKVSICVAKVRASLLKIGPMLFHTQTVSEPPRRRAKSYGSSCAASIVSICKSSHQYSLAIHLIQVIQCKQRPSTGDLGFRLFNFLHAR